MDTECVKGSDQYHSAKCDVKFNYTLTRGVTSLKGPSSYIKRRVVKTFSKCVKDEPTPTVSEDKLALMRTNFIWLFQASNPLCQDLKEKEGFTLIDEMLG